MWKKALCICSFLVLITTNVSAHVMNSQSVFEDLHYTEAEEAILVLSALGVVSAESGKQTFRPQDPLTREELGAFVGGYLGFEGEQRAELAQQALKNGYLSSTKGEATYGDVNQAFFENQLPVENPEGMMTREEFAQFVAANLETDIGGHTLASMSGYVAGPTGMIEKVQQVEKAYELTIDGNVYELGMHPYVLAETVDPLVWQGMSLTKSWIGPNDSHSHEPEAAENTLQFLKIESEPIKKESNEKPVKMEKEEGSSHMNLILIGICAIFIGVFSYYLLRRPKNKK